MLGRGRLGATLPRARRCLPLSARTLQPSPRTKGPQKEAWLYSDLDPNTGEKVPRLEGDFDFVFLDAGDNDGFRRLVWPRVRPGGAVAECGLFGIISVTYKK